MMEIYLKRILQIYRWSTVYQVMFCIVAGIAVFYYGYSNYIVNKKDELESLIQEEMTLKKVYEKNYLESINLELWEDRLVEVRVDAAENLLRLPSSLSIENLLMDISRIGAENNVVFLVFKPMDENNKREYVESNVQIRVRGGFAQIGGFINDIGNAPNLMTVTNLKLGKANDGMLILDADIKAYKQGNLRGL